MSGGTFEYDQYRIQNIIDTLEDVIGNYGTEHNVEDLSEDTFKAFQRGLNYLNIAYIYAHRIDYLLAYDDGEDSFHERLQDDLDKYFHEVEEL